MNPLYAYLAAREVATGRAPVKDDITWSQESSTRRAGVAALLPEPQLRRHALHAGLRARRAPAVGPYLVSPQQHWQEAVVVGPGSTLPYHPTLHPTLSLARFLENAHASEMMPLVSSQGLQTTDS